MRAGRLLSIGARGRPSRPQNYLAAVSPGPLRGGGRHRHHGVVRGPPEDGAQLQTAQRQQPRLSSLAPVGNDGEGRVPPQVRARREPRHPESETGRGGGRGGDSGDDSERPRQRGSLSLEKLLVCSHIDCIDKEVLLAVYR